MGPFFVVEFFDPDWQRYRPMAEFDYEQEPRPPESEYPTLAEARAGIDAYKSANPSVGFRVLECREVAA